MSWWRPALPFSERRSVSRNLALPWVSFLIAEKHVPQTNVLFISNTIFHFSLSALLSLLPSFLSSFFFQALLLSSFPWLPVRLFFFGRVSLSNPDWPSTMRFSCFNPSVVGVKGGSPPPQFWYRTKSS